MKYFLLLLLLISLAGLIIPSAFADNVPDWVKNTAGWWATDAISETEFVNAIEFLIKNGIIKIDDTCIYEINRVFKYTDQKIINQLCNNEYNLDYTKEVAVIKPSDIQINEFGFRGPNSHCLINKSIARFPSNIGTF